MYDLSEPADQPGRCPKCRGTGLYCWGGTINGKPVHSGPCHSCNGTGKQDKAQIARNQAYNRHKINRLMRGE
jgi:DnaJ-class molecular chaperone